MPYIGLILAGAISSLGFEPLNLWPLTFIAIATLIGSVANATSVREAFMCGWAFGIGHFIVGLNWIAVAFTYQVAMPPWFGAIAVVILSFYLALFPALSSALSRFISRNRQFEFTFTFAIAWMLGEWLRATLFSGFAWNPIGVVWLHPPYIATLAKWIGTYGLSALVIIVSGFFWLSIQRHRKITTAVAVLLAVASTAVQHLSPRPKASETLPVPIRIVQPNISQGEKYDAAQEESQFQIYISLSGEPSTTPTLLFWPEAATLRFLEIDSLARRELASVLGPSDVLLMGGPSIEPTSSEDNYLYHNSVFAVDSTGSLIWRYDKAHLVPFGEYLPARAFFQGIGLSRLVPGDGDFTAGPGPRTFQLHNFGSAGTPMTIGVQICYEIIFSGNVIDEAHRPTLLFNPSNDAWFGAWGPPQHLAQAQLRAIEEGVAIVRATQNGISALIGPTGQLIASIPPHQPGVIDAFVPKPLPVTVFAKYRLWICALFGLFLALVGLTPRIMESLHFGRGSR